VVFDKVSFAFDDHVVLHDISFEIPTEACASAGASGGGSAVLGYPPAG
jgi:ABC-type multidrug transport system fused ATPase/permease subunit